MGKGTYGGGTFEGKGASRKWDKERDEDKIERLAIRIKNRLSEEWEQLKKDGPIDYVLENGASLVSEKLEELGQPVKINTPLGDIVDQQLEKFANGVASGMQDAALNLRSIRDARRNARREEEKENPSFIDLSNQIKDEVHQVLATMTGQTPENIIAKSQELRYDMRKQNRADEPQTQTQPQTTTQTRSTLTATRTDTGRD